MADDDDIFALGDSDSDGGVGDGGGGTGDIDALLAGADELVAAASTGTHAATDTGAATGGGGDGGVGGGSELDALEDIFGDGDDDGDGDGGDGDGLDGIEGLGVVEGEGDSDGGADPAAVAPDPASPAPQGTLRPTDTPDGAGTRPVAGSAGSAGGGGLDMSLRSLGLSDVSPSAVKAVDVGDPDGAHAGSPNHAAIKSVVDGLARDMHTAGYTQDEMEEYGVEDGILARAAADVTMPEGADVEAEEEAPTHGDGNGEGAPGTPGATGGGDEDLLGLGIGGGGAFGLGVEEALRQLRVEMASERPDMSYVGDLCVRCGNTVPADLRRAVWPRLLGVWGHDRVDPIAAWEAAGGGLEDLDLAGAEVAGVREQAARLAGVAADAAAAAAALAAPPTGGDGDDIDAVDDDGIDGGGGVAMSAGDIELVLAFYCRRRGVRMTPSLHAVLEPFVRLFPTSRVAAFNSFYAFAHRYLPGAPAPEAVKAATPIVAMTPTGSRDADGDGDHVAASSPRSVAASLTSARAHEMLRVLLVYHAPRLERALAEVWPQWYLPRRQGGAVPDSWLSALFAGPKAMPSGAAAAGAAAAGAAGAGGASGGVDAGESARAAEEVLGLWDVFVLHTLEEDSMGDAGGMGLGISGDGSGAGGGGGGQSDSLSLVAFVAVALLRLRRGELLAAVSLAGEGEGGGVVATGRMGARRAAVAEVLDDAVSAVLADSGTGGAGAGAGAGGGGTSGGGDFSSGGATPGGAMTPGGTRRLRGVSGLADLVRRMEAVTPESFKRAFDDAASGRPPADDDGGSGGGGGGGGDGGGAVVKAPVKRSVWLRRSIGQSLADLCPSVDADDIMPQLTPGVIPGAPPPPSGPVSPTSGQVRYFVLDVRPSGLRHSGRFATAYHVDVDTFTDERGPAGDAKGAAKAKAAAAAAAAAKQHKQGGGDASSGAGAGGDGKATKGRVAELAAGSGGGGASPRPASPGGGAFSARGVPLDWAVARLGSLKGAMTICVMGMGVRMCYRAYRADVVKRAVSTDVRRVRHVVRRLQEAGFPRVCVLADGYASAYNALRRHRLVMRTLVDYKPDKCPCRRHELAGLEGGGGGGRAGPPTAPLILGSALDKPRRSPPRPDPRRDGGKGGSGGSGDRDAADIAKGVGKKIGDVFSGLSRRRGSGSSGGSGGDGTVSLAAFARSVGDSGDGGTGGDGGGGGGGPRRASASAAAGGASSDRRRSSGGASDLASDAASAVERLRAASTGAAQSWLRKMSDKDKDKSKDKSKDKGKEKDKSEGQGDVDVADALKASLSRFGGRLSVFGKEIADKAERAARDTARETRELAERVEDKLKETRRGSSAAGAATAAEISALEAAARQNGGGGERRGSGSGSGSGSGGGGGGGTAAPAFTIDDDDVLADDSDSDGDGGATGAGAGNGDGSGGGSDDPHAKEREAALSAHRLAGLAKGAEVEIDVWGDALQLHRCEKEKALLGGISVVRLVPRYLGLCKERLLVLEAHSSKLNVGVVKSNHHLMEIVKVFANKRDESRLTLHYAKGVDKDGAPRAAKRSYLLADRASFVKALIEHRSKLVA